MYSNFAQGGKPKRKRVRTFKRRKVSKSPKKVRKTPTNRPSSFTSPRACSPRNKSTYKAGSFHTCYTYKALETIADAYNRTVSSPAHKIVKPTTKKSKKELWTNIKTKLDQIPGCEGEWCWIHQPLA